METEVIPSLLNLAKVSARTGLSRAVLYREFMNPRGKDGVVKTNPSGRLKVVYVGRAVRVAEADLRRFIELLGA
jgi:predicted DNA-binding transcriptional regulator AlpA